MQTNIYVVAHKCFCVDELKLDKCYNIIAVGKKAEKCQKQMNALSDSEGENITEKNGNYCELTAQYWYWKNDNSSDVVGLCHYRRYFTRYQISKSINGILREKDINKILSKYDVIVPQKEYSCRGAYKAYLDCGYEKDLEALEEVVKNYFCEYMPEYIKYFKLSAGNFPANMYIARKEISDEYSKWLFEVLLEVEKKIDISKYSTQEARVFGYMSERLLGVWLYHNGYKMKKIRIINTEEKVSLKWYLLEILKKIKIYQGIKILIFQFKRGR